MEKVKEYITNNYKAVITDAWNVTAKEKNKVHHTTEYIVFNTPGNKISICISKATYKDKTTNYCISTEQNPFITDNAKTFDLFKPYIDNRINKGV